MAEQDRIKFDKERLRAFCKTHGIRYLALFGSVLTDQFGPDSDVDVLVDFLPHRIPGFFKMASMEVELTQIFGNRKVDLRTPQDLSPHFRDKVLATAEVQYAR
ncbi:nucleotidyltransferase family protein [Planctomycetota bacterium]